MRTFTTFLAIAALVLHLLLGCCWHHAHGASEVAGHHHDAHGCSHVHLPSWIWTSTTEHCEHHHHHGHNHDRDDSDESDTTPHAPCSDPQCVFLVSGQLSVPAGDELVAPISSADFVVAQQVLIAEVVDLAPREKADPHLRRHLALSRFLN